MIRFLAALCSALVISAGLFLLMAYLIQPQKNVEIKANTLANIEFVDRKESEVEPENTPEPEPEPEKEPPPPPLQPKIPLSDIDAQEPALDIPALDLLPAEFAGLQGARIEQGPLTPIVVKPEEIKLSSEAIAIVAVTPEYPARLRKRKIEGSVTVEFVINKKGKAEQIRVVKATPEKSFDRVVISAVQRSKYKPVIVEGEVIQHIVSQTFNFRSQ